MIINKITTGFVIQRFDTEEKKFVGQEFIAGDEVEYEFEGAESAADDKHVEESGIKDNYLPYNMIQP